MKKQTRVWILFGLIVLGAIVYANWDKMKNQTINIYEKDSEEEKMRLLPYSGEYTEEIIYTPNSITTCTDGVCNLILYSGLTFYDDGTGYKNLDTSFTAYNQDGYDMHLKYSIYDFMVKNNSNWGDGTKYCVNKTGTNYCLVYQPSDMSYKNSFGSQDYISSVGGVSAVYSENIVTYPNIYSNVNLTLIATNEILKENYILTSEPRTPQSWLGNTSEITLDFGGYIKYGTLKIYSDGIERIGNFNTSNRIEFKLNNETLFYLPSPIITDSIGESITGLYQVINQGEQIFFYVKTPYNFLDNATYPVYIDPSVSLQTADTDNLADTASYAAAANLDDNYGTNALLPMSDGSELLKRNTLMRWNLSQIPSGAIIDSANLSLYNTANGLDASTEGYNISTHLLYENYTYWYMYTIADSTIPRGLAINGTHIFNADSDDDEIYIYFLNGTYFTSFDTCVNSGSLACDIFAVAVNDSFIWVTDTADDEIYKFWLNGTYTAEHWDTAANCGGSPQGLTTNNTWIWVSDTGNDDICKYSMTGTYISEFDAGASGCDYNYGIAQDGTYIYCSEPTDDKIYRFWMNGTYTSFNFDVGAYENDNVVGVAYYDGYIYTSDQTRRLFFRYNTTGTLSFVSTLDSPWEELKSSWNNRPNSSFFGDKTSDVYFFGGVGEPLAWQIWDVSSIIQYGIDNSMNNVSIYLQGHDYFGTTDATDFQSFSSKEGATAEQRPYLNITYSEGEADTTAPTWSSNSTNSTYAGEAVKHNVYWTDTALSGYIFSFDNGTGTFVNDSLVSMTGTTNWSNVTKVVNSTVGSTIKWKVYTNDTTGNMNITSEFSYLTTTISDSCTYSGAGDWMIECSDNCVITTDTNLAGNVLIFNGTGSVTMDAELTGMETMWKDKRCKVLKTAAKRWAW